MLRGSSFFNAILQCLSHIPAVSRLILETDLLEDVMKIITPLSQFVVQLLINNKFLSVDTQDLFQAYPIDKLISTDQNLGLEFSRIFEFVQHPIFGFFMTKNILHGKSSSLY